MDRYKKAVNTLMLTLGIFAACAPAQKIFAQGYDDIYNNYDQNGYANQDGDVTLQTFYDDLAPYGQWVEDPQYGYVFVPNVENGFRPYYTDGHWVMTDYGNTWVSDYPWGWAAFHYGRWTYDNYYGWIWIPGTVWGPAWVDWRYGDGDYGWAPLGPGFEISMGLDSYYCPDDWWVFLPPQYLYTPRYYRYWGGPGENSNIINRSTVINNTFSNNSANATYTIGPRPADIENKTNRPVTIYRLANRSTPNTTRVRNNTVSMYHPMVVREAPVNGGRPVPPNAVRAPQPITTRPQPAKENNTPAFRNDVQRIAPQTPMRYQPQNAQQTQPQQRGNYEYNVQRPIPQPQQQPTFERPQEQFRPAPAPQPQYRPAPQPQYRPAPQPQYRPAPQPQYRPAPQPQYRPAPQPQYRPAPQVGGRR